MVSKKRLSKTIKSASKHHHNYEKNVLKGKRDKNWAGWYAGYIFGRMKRLEKQMNVSKLVNLLKKASKKVNHDNWAKKYAEHIYKEMRKK